MGGSIAVRSEPGRGSLFLLDIPFPEADGPAKRIQPIVADSLKMKKTKKSAWNRSSLQVNAS